MLSRRALVAVGATGTGVRLLWVLVAHRTPEGLRDPFLYQRFAESIASGRGYTSLYGQPTSYYPPGYPFFLGAIEWLGDLVGLDGHLPLLAGLAQAALGGIAAVATALAAARVAGPRVGLGAGMVLGLWPNLVLYSSTLLSETLYLACFAALLAVLVRLPGDGSWRLPALAGALLGLTTLVRPQVLLVLPAAVLAWLVVGRRREALRAGATVLGVAVLVVAPWTVRNAVVLGGFVPVSTNGGDNLCVGFHEGAPGHFAIPAACDTGEFYVDGPAAELRRDAETARRARTWALGHLSALPALSARKLFHTYRSDTDGLRAVESYEADRWLPDVARRGLRLLVNGTWAVIGLAALAGTVLVWRARRDPERGIAARTLLAVTTASALVPVLFFGDGRFKVPTAPCLAVLAAVAAVAALDRFRARVQRPAAESS